MSNLMSEELESLLELYDNPDLSIHEHFRMRHEQGWNPGPIVPYLAAENELTNPSPIAHNIAFMLEEIGLYDFNMLGWCGDMTPAVKEVTDEMPYLIEKQFRKNLHGYFALDRKAITIQGKILEDKVQWYIRRPDYDFSLPG